MTNVIRLKNLKITVPLIVLMGCIIPGEVPEKSVIDVSRILDTPWDDYSLFYEGLVTSERPIIDQLPEATVYHLDLRISPDCLLLQGHEEVLYTNQEEEPLDKIYFRLFPNIRGGKASISAVMVDNQDVEPVYELEKSAVSVPVSSLEPGEKVVIQMDFAVEIPQGTEGNYGHFGYFDGVLSLDAVYPVIPVYDEEWNVEIPPSHGDITYLDASFYVVRVTAPFDLKIAASGIEIGAAYDGNSQILAFVAGPARDFYLAASKTYAVVTGKIGETKINSYFLPGGKNEAKTAIKIVKNAFKDYNERFGVYPYTEFDMVATYMQAKGMEYPGVVALSQVLYDSEAVISGMPSRDMLEIVVAHEAAHQWFYNVVGNDQVDEPWLDEAIAQYVTGLYYEDEYGEKTAQEYRSSWDSLWGIVGREDIPVGLSSTAYESDEYGAIVYGRGPLFISELAKKMGEKSFDDFLRTCYESYKWGIVTTNSFRQLAESFCQCDLGPLFEQWVYS